MSDPRVSASGLAARFLASTLLSGYDLGACQSCRLHMSGVNDIHIAELEGGRFVLKVYRHGWRSLADVSYEIDFLTHLHRGGIRVSLPVPDRSGTLVQSVFAPEGNRPAVLFPYAPGRPPIWPFHEDEAESRLLGETLASIHLAGTGFESPHPRAALDEALLLDCALTAVYRHITQVSP